MKNIVTALYTGALLLLTGGAIAQPLPCPPINTTTIQAHGDTTICLGSCTTLTNTHTTTVKSTSSYAYSTIPYLPTDFTGRGAGAVSTGNVLVGFDDIYSAAVPIPFDFCFYGTKYNSCVIGANGEISFTAGDAGGSCPWEISGPITSPTSAELNAATLNSIMGVYYDIDPQIPPNGTISWAVYGTAPCRTFVVSWDSIPLFNAGTCPGMTGTQQIVLYESTYAIDIFVHHKPICTAWNNGWGIIGIVDATGANFNIPAAYNATVFALDDAGFRFTPNAPAVWTYKWTDPSGTVVSTSADAYVCPTVNTTYQLEGIASSNCDSYRVYSSATVLIGPNPTVTHFTPTNPSMCSIQDGSITLYGLVPGIADTIYYKYNGVLQPLVAQTSLSDSSLTLSNLCAGVYDSIVVQVGHCHTDPLSITLTAPPIPIGTATYTPPTVCLAENGTLTINGVVPNTTFIVNYTKNGTAATPITLTSTATGTITIPNLGAATYDNINVTGNVGPCNPAAPCVSASIGPVVIPEPPAFNVNVTAFTSPTQCGYCDGSMTLRAVLPYATDTFFYTYNGVVMPPIINIAQPDSSIYLPGLCAGDYSNMSLKVGTCPSVVPGIVTLINPTITPSFSFTNHFGCNGDTVVFDNHSTASGPLYYIWNFGDSTTDTAANPSHIYAQGIYTITMTANNHVCDTTFTLSDSLIHPLKASFIDTPFIYCQSTPVTFTNTTAVLPGATITYEWLLGDGTTTTDMNPVHTYPNSGVYNVQLIATNFVPCSDTQSLKVYIDSNSAIGLSVTDTAICRSSTITFQGHYTDIGNVGIIWNFGDGDSIVNKNPVSHAFDGEGTFTVTATARYRKCKDTSVSKSVNIYPGPSIYIGPDTSICKGSEAITLMDAGNATNPKATWVWNNGATTPGITVVEPGNYYATVGINGCYASDTVTVSNDCYMNIPNVFSPNNDGVNDYFYPMQYLTKGLLTFKMDIYNRWGQLLFEGTALDGRGWDGKFNGLDQPEGVYIYIIDATFKDGQKQHHQGNITLLR